MLKTFLEHSKLLQLRRFGIVLLGFFLNFRHRRLGSATTFARPTFLFFPMSLFILLFVFIGFWFDENVISVLLISLALFLFFLFLPLP